jgi:hypothetical protein
MTTSIPDLRDGAGWRAAVEPAASEIALYALGFTAAKVERPDADYSGRDKIGAHLPLLGGPRALELALVGTEAACRAVAGAMLQSAPESLAMPEVADAMGEALNMLGGAIKRRFNSPDLELGLPLFVLGHVQATASLAILALPTHFGPIAMHTLVIGRRG